MSDGGRPESGAALPRKDPPEGRGTDVLIERFSEDPGGALELEALAAGLDEKRELVVERVVGGTEDVRAAGGDEERPVEDASSDSAAAEAFEADAAEPDGAVDTVPGAS